MFNIEDQIRKSIGASSIVRSESVQTLWSGYGEIKRYFLEGGKYPSVIVKHIDLPLGKKHPRGWNTPLSHQRKVKSYQVERRWYEQYANRTDDKCRIPQSFLTLEEGASLLFIMEDLDGSGYNRRLHHDHISLEAAKACLTWLAHFHGTFMGDPSSGLWPVGTYWHLDTRPDELENMGNYPLKEAAIGIDEQLKKAKFQTLVHGDSKLANFCFGSNPQDVAAVDFQYVGRGCGMKDVAYFISSCFHEEDCELHEEVLLEHYFDQLEISMTKYADFHRLKKEWSELYKYAWADFYRFLDGWSPGHWKMHKYSERLTKEVIDELK